MTVAHIPPTPWLRLHNLSCMWRRRVRPSVLNVDYRSSLLKKRFLLVLPQSSPDTVEICSDGDFHRHTLAEAIRIMQGGSVVSGRGIPPRSEKNKKKAMWRWGWWWCWLRDTQTHFFIVSSGLAVVIEKGRASNWNLNWFLHPDKFSNILRTN